MTEKQEPTDTEALTPTSPQFLELVTDVENKLEVLHHNLQSSIEAYGTLTEEINKLILERDTNGYMALRLEQERDAAHRNLHEAGKKIRERDATIAKKTALDHLAKTYLAGLDNLAARMYNIYDAAKVLPEPHNDIKGMANSLLHDYVGIASSLSAYFEVILWDDPEPNIPEPWEDPEPWVFSDGATRRYATQIFFDAEYLPRTREQYEEERGNQ